MKKYIILFLAMLFSFTCFGCVSFPLSHTYGDDDEIDYEAKENEFCFHLVSTETTAVGDIKDVNRKEYYFIPEKDGKYIVTHVGFGETVGRGRFTNESEAKVPNTFYLPYTIEYIYRFYFQHARYDIRIMYCGSVIDLNLYKESSDYKHNIYVPSSKYEEFLSKYSGDGTDRLLKANVVYDLNYEGKEYYYVDYVSNNDCIVNIPPIPSRDGYVFDGWYQDKTFNQQWDFYSPVMISEDDVELRLYAKWV